MAVVRRLSNRFLALGALALCGLFAFERPSKASTPETEACARAKADVARLFDSTFSSGHASALIQFDDRVLLSRQYGAGVGERSRFLLASLTKTLHGAIAERLIDHGRLDLEAPVLGELPAELAFLKPPSWSKLRVRHLLHHTSGIPDYLDAGLEDYLRLPRALPALVAFVPSELRFEPDTRLEYSNTNYLVLAWILERRLNLADGDVLAQELAGPLGLADTGMLAEPDPAVLGGSGVALANLPGVGNAFSSARDLMTFLRALDSTAYLTNAGLKRLFSPDPACHGERCGRYGIGWSLRLDGPDALEGAVPWVLHTGHLSTVSNVIAKVPDLGLDVVVLSDLASVDTENLAREALIRLIRAGCNRQQQGESEQ